MKIIFKKHFFNMFIFLKFNMIFNLILNLKKNEKFEKLNRKKNKIICK